MSHVTCVTCETCHMLHATWHMSHCHMVLAESWPSITSGGCLGHTVCTGAAVLFGMIVAKFISARFLTLIGKDDTSLHCWCYWFNFCKLSGALVFIGFGIASILTDPNKDGIDGIPDIPVNNFKRLNRITSTLFQGYDNCTRLINHNISLTLDLEEMIG